MKKIPNWIKVFLLLALLIASKFLFFAKKEPPQNKNKTSQAIVANYYVVKPSLLQETISVIGKTGSINQVDIKSETNGKIISINFKEGQVVAKGDLLVKLNDSEIQAQLQKIKTQIKFSEKKLNRLNELLKAKAVSQEEFEMQESELQTFKAEESLIMAQLVKTSIYAPFSGVIGLKKISEGEVITNNTSIVSLVQLDKIFIEFMLPEKYFNLINNNLIVSFTTEDFKNEFQAKVYAQEPVADANSKSILVRAMVLNAINLIPNLFIQVKVKIEQKENSLLIPTQCVIGTLKGQKIYIYKHGDAIETPVKIGYRSDTQIEITEGLNANDTVLSTGLLAIKKDSKIKLITANH